MAKAQTQLEKELAKFRERQAKVANNLIKDTAKRKPSSSKALPGKNGKVKDSKASANTFKQHAQQLTPEPSTSSKSGKDFLRSVIKPTVKQKSPLGKRIKDVVDLLHKEGRAMTAEEVTQALRSASGNSVFDLTTDQELQQALANNQRIEIQDGQYVYKALHDLKDKAELLRLLLKGPDGTHTRAIKDSYKGVEEDIQSLQEEGLIYRIHSTETQDYVLYPRDQKLKVQVDADIIAEFFATEIPSDPMEVEEELRKAKVPVAMKSGVRKRAPPPPKEKKKREYNMRIVTNTHMPELFMQPAPTQID